MYPFSVSNIPSVYHIQRIHPATVTRTDRSQIKLESRLVKWNYIQQLMKSKFIDINDIQIFDVILDPNSLNLDDMRVDIALNMIECIYQKFLSVIENYYSPSKRELNEDKRIICQMIKMLESVKLLLVIPNSSMVK